jgi:DNA-binding transcriptional regulator GbsR (MarR family)
MINKRYLEQALRIRKDYMKTDNKLLSLKDDLLKINEDIIETLEKLKKVRDNTDKYKSNEEFQEDVIKYLKEFEDQSKRVDKLYKPLNEEMENLKKEEQELYKTLVQNYPNVKEENLVEEIQSYLRTNIGL